MELPLELRVAIDEKISEINIEQSGQCAGRSENHEFFGDR